MCNALYRNCLSLLLCSLSLAIGFITPAFADEDQSIAADEVLAPNGFIQIPGPNPILTAGKPGDWDDRFVEIAGVFEELGTYYLYYHGMSREGEGYQVGVATAKNPLGPFKKIGDAPQIPRGEPGTWDDAHTFCGKVVKLSYVDVNTKTKYYMIYGAKDAKTQESDPFVCHVGIATADSPLGPWTKSPNNPILKDFGYPGGVVEWRGKWYMYNAFPISSTGGRDYSPMAVATADKLEGPWTKYEGNPILDKGGWGEWDDGGFSEANVFVAGDMFHMFYGGAKPATPRFLSRESIGYAYSRDGLNWKKYPRNPVAVRQEEFNAAAYAEIFSVHEPPFVYCYHTLRYCAPWRERDKNDHPDVEDLGVQILATQRPFSLDMPMIVRDEVGPGTSTTLSLEDTKCISVGQVDSATLTVRCKFDKTAQDGIRVHVRSSYDGEHFDTDDYQTIEVPVQPGKAVQQTINVKPGARYLKAIVENMDDGRPVTDVEVWAALRG